ncbi:hypothetical protein RAHE111665_00365 [Rariglobus hedericola]
MKASSRIPLSEGLSLYWKHLVPITILPIVLFLGIGFKQARVFWIFIPLFYGCGYYARFPVLKRNVTYLFWIVGGVLFMGVGTISFIILTTLETGSVR